jgi:hypothetical protein
LYSEISFHHFGRECGEQIISAGIALNVWEIGENKGIQFLHFTFVTAEVID